MLTELRCSFDKGFCNVTEEIKVSNGVCHNFLFADLRDKVCVDQELQ
jgi:hypothetical protein